MVFSVDFILCDGYTYSFFVEKEVGVFTAQNEISNIIKDFVSEESEFFLRTGGSFSAENVKHVKRKIEKQLILSGYRVACMTPMTQPTVINILKKKYGKDLIFKVFESPIERMGLIYVSRDKTKLYLYDSFDETFLYIDLVDRNRDKLIEILGSEKELEREIYRLFIYEEYFDENGKEKSF